MSPARGIPLVVAAASGTGKTSVCRAVIERNAERGGRAIVFSVSVLISTWAVRRLSLLANAD